MRTFPLFVCTLLLIVSCGGQQQKKATTATTAEKTEKFTVPTIPVALVTPEDRAKFLVVHYWDNFNFCDTTLISKAEITEQAFADFINLLPHSPNSTEGITTMLKKAEADSAMFAHFASLSEKYLYDPNSPFRNEDYYIAALNVITKSDKIDELNKIRPLYQLEMAMQNRVGDKAAMFPQLAKAKGDPILLFFFNPDCDNCKAIKEYITERGIDKKASILMVNPDENKELDKIYDLRAIPTLYLLSKDKTVLLKDATIEQIDQYLSN